METYEINPTTDDSLSITREMKENLLEMTKWSKFLAILGFVGLGMIVVSAIYGLVIGSMSRYSYLENAGIAALIYIAIAVVYYFPVNFLYKASVGIKDGLILSNKIDLESGIDNLKSHYKYIGITAIVLVSLNIILIFVGLLAITLHG